MMGNPIVDPFKHFLLRHFTYLQATHIKDMFTLFTALYVGLALALGGFIRIWVKARIVFEDINDPNIIVARFHKGEVYETQVRSDVFKNFSSVLNATFALLIAHHKRCPKVFVWQVRKLEKAVTIAFFIALLLAVFGVMCALDTMLPPGYKLP